MSRSLRLEALTDDSAACKGPGRTPHGNFVLSEISVTAAPKSAPATAQPVKIATARGRLLRRTAFPSSTRSTAIANTGWAIHAPGKTLNVDERDVHFREADRISRRHAHRRASSTSSTASSTRSAALRLSFGSPVQRRETQVRATARASWKKFAEWLTRERERAVAWTPLRPSQAKSNLPLLTVQADASVFASGDITKSDTYDLKFADVPRGHHRDAPRSAARRTPARARSGHDLLRRAERRFLPGRVPSRAPTEQPVKFAQGDRELREECDRQELRQPPRSRSTATRRPAGSATAARAKRTRRSSCSRSRSSPRTSSQLQDALRPPLRLSLGRFRISVTTDPRGAEAREMRGRNRRSCCAMPDATAHRRAARSTCAKQFLLTAPELADRARRDPTNCASRRAAHDDAGHARTPAGQSAADVPPPPRRVPAADGARRARRALRSCRRCPTTRRATAWRSPAGSSRRRTR